MGDSFDKEHGCKFFPTTLTSRRDFLRLTTLGAVGAIGTPAMAGPFVKFAGQGSRADRGNSMPGRIVRFHDPEMGGQLPTIDRDRVENVVHQGVRLLTGIDDTAAAFESLFPGLHSGSTFAVKVNCIGPTCTRWEVARGVVSGLSLMLGAGFDVSQVIVFDRHNLHSYGYEESEFTFNGHYPLISHTNNASGSGHYVWGSHELSRYILDCDYVIDIPALKSHSNSNEITVAMKNHYGSCQPASLCGNLPAMLTLNADANIKDKTCLVLTDALRATFNGGPSEPPQDWSNYSELTPNTLFFTTDPVTNEYWARETINSQRIVSGLAPKSCPWIKQASGDPYYLGISDPEQMTMVEQVRTSARSLSEVKALFR